LKPPGSFLFYLWDLLFPRPQVCGVPWANKNVCPLAHGPWSYIHGPLAFRFPRPNRFCFFFPRACFPSSLARVFFPPPAVFLSSPPSSPALLQRFPQLNGCSRLLTPRCHLPRTTCLVLWRFFFSFDDPHFFGTAPVC